ncbi:hypothetical protein PHYPSEUDO_014822 [Phytophthora pseudosyringae]|uniref:Uncharacterized protein n=1 Tax=Phytophthora pseudosyringae TaxID=221518 RepID=A0A8T1VZW1_9STRA|nr:hypothetical protein PHYPSEUDO_014822 [Phytophthora pseudosyringae]
MCRTIEQQQAMLFEPSLPVGPPSMGLPFCFSSSKTAFLKTLTAPPKDASIRRSGLEFVLSATGIRFKDLAFVQEVEERVAQLIVAATASTAPSTNTRLARKTLKFRNIGQPSEAPGKLTALTVL